MTQTHADPGVIVEPKGQPGNSGSRTVFPKGDWKKWLARFQAQHGRPPRILHIGNVANNGYNNAKVLVEAGFDCDAICYDYYHIMGCPEWEDADFTGMVADHFMPDWNQVDLRGFERPRWFAQGPLLWAIGYLIARRDKRVRSTRALWLILRFHQWLVAHRTSWWYRRLKAMGRRLSAARNRHQRSRPRSTSTGSGSSSAFWIRVKKPIRLLNGSAANSLRSVRSMEARIRSRSARWLWPLPSLIRLLIYLLKLPILLVGFVLLLACLPFALVFHVFRSTLRRLKPIRKMGWTARVNAVKNRFFLRLTGVDPAALYTPEFQAQFQTRAETLINDFARRFPDRTDQLEMRDILPYQSIIPLWCELLKRYDAVEAYATDPIIPMLCGYEQFVSYEHGTIREIPFEDSPTGRLTALAYARSAATIITNPDCRDAAIRLGVPGLVPIPHLIDRKYYNPMIADAGTLPPEIRPPYIFSPARHDWDVKGTHILIESFARIAREFPDLQLVTPSWGADLERSREFIAQLGISNRVAMIDPMNIHNLIRVTRGAQALVDQFRFGVFGGIGPTALAVGTPLITHLDHGKSNWWMEPPPYFEAWDVESCVVALRQALTADAGALRANLRAWMRRNYWHGQVVDRHACVFAALIGHTPLEHT